MDIGGPVHHISPMGSAARLTAPAYPARSRQRLEAGDPAHMPALKSAIVDAVSAAVQTTHEAGHPVYVLDDEGNLCLQTASGSLRKLSDAEVEAALS